MGLLPVEIVMQPDICKGFIGLDVSCIDFANNKSQRLRITLVDEKQFLRVAQLLQDRLGAVLEPLHMNCVM